MEALLIGCLVGILTSINLGISLLVFKMYSEVLKVMALTKKPEKEYEIIGGLNNPVTYSSMGVHCGRCNDLLYRDGRGNFLPCSCRQKATP